jgi:hypothetical protein
MQLPESRSAKLLARKSPNTRRLPHMASTGFLSDLQRKGRQVVILGSLFSAVWWSWRETKCKATQLKNLLKINNLKIHYKTPLHKPRPRAVKKCDLEVLPIV